MGKLQLKEEISTTNHPGYVFNSKLSSRVVTNADMDPDTTLNNPDSRNHFSTKLTYDIPLFTGFKLSNQKDILKLQKKANELKYNLSKQQLTLEVLKAYNGAVVAKEYVKAIKKAKKSINHIEKSANAFYKEGLVTNIDVQQTKVHKFNTNSKLIDVQNKFYLALSYLSFLTNDYKITDVTQQVDISCNLKQTNELYNMALENRDELKMLDINKKAMKKNIDISNSSYFPNIYAHVEYGFNDDKLTFDDSKDYYTALIGLNYTIFDNTRSIIKQKSKIEYQKANLNYDNIKNAIKLEVDKAVLNLEAKKKILLEKMEAKRLAKKVFDKANLMYKNQLTSINDLLQFEANLQKYKADVIAAKYEKSLAQANLTLILGQDLINKGYNQCLKN